MQHPQTRSAKQTAPTKLARLTRRLRSCATTPLHEPHFRYNPTGARSPEPGARSPEPGARSPEPGARSPEPGARSPEPGARSPEPGARSPEPGARSPEPGARSPEPGARSPEPGARSPEPGARSPEPGPEPGARSPEPGARSPEPGARSPEPGAPACGWIMKGATGPRGGSTDAANASRARRSVPVALALLALPLLGALAPAAEANKPNCSASSGPYPAHEDWVFTPDSLDAGDTFRLLFATSTTSKADAVSPSVYNTFVRNAAKGGHGQIPASCGNKFNAIISTQYDSARFNTRTRSTDTDAPIWWVKGEKVADNYADFYDGSWDSRIARNEYGTTPIDEQRVWTGSLSNGHHPGSGYAGHFGVEVRRGHLKTGDPLNAGSTNSGAKYRLYGLSPIFTVVKDPRLSLSLAKTSANEGNAGVSHVIVKAKLDKRRSTDTSFKLCVKNTSTATFRTSTSTNDRDFDLYDYPWNAQLTTNASNCHTMTIKTNFKERAVRLFIYGDTTKEENETVVLELKDPPSDVKIASSGRTATYTITNDDSEPTVTITGGATASEGTNATFTVKSSHAPKNALSVKVNITEDEDADTGKDHVAAADEGVRTVTVAAGSTSQSFTVPTSEDWVDEPDGVITATVQAGTGYVVGQANKSAQVNVEDDDTRGFEFSPTKLDIKEEGTATYTVNLTSQPRSTCPKVSP